MGRELDFFCGTKERRERKRKGERGKNLEASYWQLVQ
jgi:hypothetical protein